MTAFKQQFIMPNGEPITSVVMDLAEFEELADSLHGIVMLNYNCKRTADTQIDAIKAAKTIPMMSRGTKTEAIFEKYQIETDLASFIVRGEGRVVANMMKSVMKKSAESN